MDHLSADLDKLQTLARDGIAEPSKTGKAALYAAARWLISDIEGEVEEYAPHLGEELDRLTGSLSAVLGFDSTDGHSLQQHLAWTMTAIQNLRDGFDRLEDD